MTRRGDIQISPKHGLNPSMGRCEVCGRDTGEILLLGRLKGDAEAPRTLVHGLCDDCRRVREVGGVIFIEVRDGESGDDPYRTGRVVGITREAAERLLPPGHAALSKGVAYVEETALRRVMGETP